MPPHYALSEALIVLAAIFCGYQLARRSQWMGAFGVLLFGAAASIGVYRFPSGQIEELASIHRWAGQIGGLAGMGLIASELVRRAAPPSRRSIIKLVLLLSLMATTLIAILNSAIAVPFFLIWSLVSIVAAFALPASILNRFCFALCAALMQLNVIFIRQADYLGQDISWHLFHTLVAIWIFAIYWILSWHHKTKILS